MDNEDEPFEQVELRVEKRLGQFLKMCNILLDSKLILLKRVQISFLVKIKLEKKINYIKVFFFKKNLNQLLTNIYVYLINFTESLRQNVKEEVKEVMRENKDIEGNMKILKQEEVWILTIIDNNVFHELNLIFLTKHI